MAAPSATLAASGNASGTTLQVLASGVTDSDFSALLSSDQGATTMTLVITGGTVATTITSIGRKSPQGAHPTRSTLGSLIGTAIPVTPTTITLTYSDLWGFSNATVTGISGSPGFGTLWVGTDTADVETITGPAVSLHNNDASVTALSATVPVDYIDIWIGFSDGSIVTPTLAAASHTSVAIQPLLH